MLPQHAAAPNISFDDDRDTPRFDWLSPIYLAPSITEQLNQGAAYGRGRWTVAAARSVVDQFIDQLIGGKYEDVHIADSDEAWSGWFQTFPQWDHTWLITDLRRHRATLLCVTDQD